MRYSSLSNCDAMTTTAASESISIACHKASNRILLGTSGYYQSSYYFLAERPSIRFETPLKRAWIPKNKPKIATELFGQ